AGLDALVRHINEQLALDLPEGRFITAFVGVLEPACGKLVYHAAGQGPLGHWCAATKRMDWFGARMPPLGIEWEPEGAAVIQMGAGDVVVLLTDGFFEYQNEAGEQYGKERAEQVVAEHAGVEAKGLLDELVRSVGTFGGAAAQMDDLTGVVIKRTAAE